ncbi:MAG: ATP-binding protein [Anaerolineae bacterium]
MAVVTWTNGDGLMAGTANRTVEVSIPSELGYEEIVMASAVIIAQKMGFARDRVDDLKMAVAEACTNAIEHGNNSDANLAVVVKMTIYEDRLCVRVRDSGQAPIPTPPPKRSHRPDNRGWGLYLIEQLVDKVEISTAPGRNEIRMVIYLEPA